jgi:nitrogen fixation NifU-like protein
MAEMYSDMVIAHFLSPQNVGTMQDPDGVGLCGDPNCGDSMTIFIKVGKGVIEDISFIVYGCTAAIAVGSMTTEMARGRTLREALEMTEQDVVEALEGLPEEKMHCSNLGASALKAAVRDYLNKRTDTGKPYREKYKK